MTFNMATIADELLNDFEDSGDENEEHIDETDFGAHSELNDAVQDSAAPQQMGGDIGMELDGDEEEVGDEDADDLVPDHLKKEEEETEEETKVRVEKMALQNVSDVRSVAGLMKQLDPLLEVSTPTQAHTCICRSLIVHDTALTMTASCRKSTTTEHPAKKRRTLDASRTIQSTRCSLNPTHSPPTSTARSYSCTSSYGTTTQSGFQNWRP